MRVCVVGPTSVLGARLLTSLGRLGYTLSGVREESARKEPCGAYRTCDGVLGHVQACRGRVVSAARSAALSGQRAGWVGRSGGGARLLRHCPVQTRPRCIAHLRVLARGPVCSSLPHRRPTQVWTW